MTISDWILLGTAVIVWMYTAAAQEANEIQQKPVLQFGFNDKTIPGNQRTGKLWVKNIGRGPAYNIRFAKILLPEDGRGIFSYQFYLDNPSLEVGELQNLKTWISTPTGGTEVSDEQRFIFRLVPRSLNPEIHAKIRKETPAIFLAKYIGLNGKKYYSVFEFYSLFPTDHMIMQFIKHDQGDCSLVSAKILCAEAERVSHPARQDNF